MTSQTIYTDQLTVDSFLAAITFMGRDKYITMNPKVTPVILSAAFTSHVPFQTGFNCLSVFEAFSGYSI